MSLDSLPAPVATTDNSKLDLVVVLAVSRMDWHLAIKWLQLVDRARLEDDELDDGLNLVVLMSPAFSAAEEKTLRAAAGFPGDWPPEEVRWARFVRCEGLNEIGYFGSPNQMFKGALDYCELRHPGRAMLWCEADTVPIGHKWWQRIRNEYRACGKPFMGDVHLCEVNHMTGNAVYHPDWRKYAPSLALLPGPELTRGWDSQCAHETFPQCHVAKTIQQIWRPAKIDKEFLETKIRPECALFHQDKTGHLIDLICDRENILRFGNYTPLAKSTYDQASFLNPVPAWGADKPKMDILIVTHWRDIEFLRYCVRSIQRFATGFNGVTIAVPKTEDDGRYKWLPQGIKVVYIDETPGKGFLHHMVTKCSADLLCPTADFILHLDPDCMLLDDCNPGHFLQDGKPILYREKYVNLRNTNRQAWAKTVAAAIGFIPEWETMVRHPAVHRAGTYARMRQLIEVHTKQSFESYVLNGQNAFPQSFCEFNTLGAVAIRDFADQYHLVEYDRSVDGVETRTNPLEGNWQYIYRFGRDKVVEFYSLHDVRIYWPKMDAILARKPEPFYVK